MPNPTPSNKATEKKTIVHTMLFQLIRYTQAESRKKTEHHEIQSSGNNLRYLTSVHNLSENIH